MIDIVLIFGGGGMLVYGITSLPPGWVVEIEVILNLLKCDCKLGYKQEGLDRVVGISGRVYQQRPVACSERYAILGTVLCKVAAKSRFGISEVYGRTIGNSSSDD